jgi:hypothetical protein
MSNINSQSFRLYSNIPFVGPRGGRLGMRKLLWEMVVDVATAPVRFVRWVDEKLAEIESREDELYLAKSTSLADLERRMRELEQRRGSFR